MNEEDFDREPRFKGHYFGAYTLTILVTGMFSGLAFSGTWYLGLLSLPMFMVSSYVFMKNKNEFVKNG